MRNLFFALTIFWIVSPAVITAQINLKKTLTEKDYALWHHVSPIGISATGEWVIYNVHYPKGPDSVYIRSTKNESFFGFSDID